jgi:hypothetical protein
MTEFCFTTEIVGAARSGRGRTWHRMGPTGRGRARAIDGDSPDARRRGGRENVRARTGARDPGLSGNGPA